MDLPFSVFKELSTSLDRYFFRAVVSVTRFSEIEEAIAWANDSDYGLEDYTTVRHIMVKLD